MKKLLAILLLTVGVSASANGPHGHYYGHRHNHNNGWGWVAPALIGGAVVYGLTRTPPPPPPANVVVVPPGYATPPVGYRYEQILDANCSCYRWALVQVY